MSWSTSPSPRSRDPIPSATRRAVLERDGHRCQLRYSGCHVRGNEVDHWDSRYRGPDRHDAHRCQTACTWCHRIKTQAEAQDAQRRARQRPPVVHPSTPRHRE